MILGIPLTFHLGCGGGGGGFSWSKNARMII